MKRQALKMIKIQNQQLEKNGTIKVQSTLKKIDGRNLFTMTNSQSQD